MKNLTFLEKLAKDTQIIKYLHYTPTKSVNWKLNTLLLNYIKSACWNQDWRRVSEFDVVKEGLLQKVEEDVVREPLHIIWNDLQISLFPSLRV